jgi:ribonuclease P protein component
VWRIRDRATFDELRRSRLRVRNGPIAVTFVPGTGPPRVAYAVGRRVGTAVVRNRVRRRLRAVVAEEAAALAPGAYLVAVRPEAAALPFEELKTTVTSAMTRVQQLGPR